MSIDATAVLVYGVETSKVDIPWIEKGIELEEFIAEQMEVFAPKGDYTSDVKFSEYFKKLEEIKQTIFCEVIENNMTEQGEYIIAITKSIITVYERVELSLSDLNIEKEWEDQLREFCCTFNSKYDEPKWWLFAEYS